MGVMGECFCHAENLGMLSEIRIVYLKYPFIKATHQFAVQCNIPVFFLTRYNPDIFINAHRKDFSVGLLLPTNTEKYFKNIFSLLDIS